MLTTVEKVIHLQDFDIFTNTSTEDLSFLAAITDEVRLKTGHVIFREGEFPGALYMILEGKIRLTRDDKDVMEVGGGDSLGTWALFDDEPMVATATTLEECLLLRIDKEEFFDFLADNASITQSIMKTLVKRMRGLMGRLR